MVTAWVVDSNAFIHLGKLGGSSVVDDLKTALAAGGATMWIASGVLEEIKTVCLQKQVGRPRVADALRPLMQVETIGEGEVRGLAQRLGGRRRRTSISRSWCSRRTSQDAARTSCSSLTTTR